jgi:predicted enzyme involved in methoxymalonyl-ACP biosynthesis
VETALLAFLLDQGRNRKMKQLRGWFLPTKKNTDLVKDFYPRHGFTKVAEQDGNTLWAWDLEKTHIPCPEWIKPTFTDEAILR